MNRETVSGLISAGQCALVAILLIFSQIAGAQEQGAKSEPDSARKEDGTRAGEKQSTPPAAKAQAADAETSAPGTPQEGIKVHGRWSIEVRNPDGKLVERRVFENSLSYGAPLYFVLGRGASTGLWFIFLGASQNGVNPCLVSNTPSSCIIGEPGGGLSGPNIFRNLTVTPPTSPNVTPLQLVLSGTATVQNTGQIGGVETLVGACAPTTAPTSCSADPGGLSYLGLGGVPLTGTGITPINVSPGQLVQATVVITFS